MIEEVRKRGRPRKYPAPNGASELSGIGKPFEPQRGYIIGRITKKSENSPRHPEFLPNTRQKKWGKEFLDAGITTTGEFFQKNPLDIYYRSPGEWWYIYVETEDGIEDFYDKGQFQRQGTDTKAEVAAPKQEQQPIQITTGASLSDTLANLFVNQSLGSGKQSSELASLFIQQLRNENDSLRSQLTTVSAEASALREKNRALEIAAGQFEVIKKAEIDAAVMNAKREQEREDEEQYAKLIEEEKAKKNGLSDAFSDPVAVANMAEKLTGFAGVLFQLPQFIKEIRGASQAGQQNEPQVQPVKYDANGNPVHTVPQLYPQNGYIAP